MADATQGDRTAEAEHDRHQRLAHARLLRWALVRRTRAIGSGPRTVDLEDRPRREPASGIHLHPPAGDGTSVRGHDEDRSRAHRASLLERGHHAGENDVKGRRVVVAAERQRSRSW